jgi:predicted enzyme related to lactoylglutathione lyase
MIISAKYVHTNLIAEDWRKLSDFYQKVFGCSVVPPERDYKGKTLDAGTGIPRVHLQGIHLRLPGCGETGPTLEILSYSPQEDKINSKVNRPGFRHIAFQVDDVEKAREIVVINGGKKIGEIVTLKLSNGKRVKWCYVTDPEGNIIELQKWI